MSEELLAALKETQVALDQAKATLDEAFRCIESDSSTVYRAVDEVKNDVEIVLDEINVAHGIVKKLREDCKRNVSRVS